MKVTMKTTNVHTMWAWKKPNKDIQSSLKAIGKTFGVSVKFTAIKNKHCGGFVDLNKRSIVLDYRHAALYVIGSFFHELSHVRNRDLGYYPIYHLGFLTKRNVKAFKSTAYKAEKFTDVEGAKLMKAYFPDLEYRMGYSTEKSRLFLRNYYKGIFKNRTHLQNQPSIK